MEAGSHYGLVEDTEAKGVVREVRVAREGGDKKVRVRQFHETELSINLYQTVLRLNTRKLRGCLLSWGVCTKTRWPVADFLHVKHPNTRISQGWDPR